MNNTKIKNSIGSICMESKNIISKLKKQNWSEGLSELLVLIQQCDEDLLLSDGSKWFKLCSQLFSKNVPNDVVTAAALAMKYLLNSCRIHIKLRTDISKISSSFLLDLCKSPFFMPIESFELIYEYLLLYSSQSMPHRGIIENTVIKYLTVNEHIMGSTAEDYYPKVVFAAKVYSVLPFSGSYESETRIEAKSNQLLELIYLSHEAMDILFKFVEIKRNMIKGTCNLNILNKKMKPSELYTSAISVFCNSHIFVQEFLTNTDSELKIACESILSIVIRPLQISPTEGKKVPENKSLRSFLPKVHQRALITMKNMLENNQGQFDYDYDVMLERLVYCLSCDTESSPLPSRTKELAYDALATLRRASNGSNVLPISLCTFIIRDITTRKNTIILNKDDKKYVEVPIIYQLEYYDDVVIAALKFVTRIYTCKHCNISNLFSQKLNSCLMEIFFNLNEGPYLNPAVRKVLYETINANIMKPMENVILPYSRIILVLHSRKQQENAENARVLDKILCSMAFIKESI